jgi:hypothetical protein
MRFDDGKYEYVQQIYMTEERKKSPKGERERDMNRFEGKG